MRRLFVVLSVLVLAASGESKKMESSEVSKRPAPASSATVPVAPTAPPTIAYSDWPVTVAWGFAIKKKRFEDASLFNEVAGVISRRQEEP
jgi:hypothetical protein